jgi:hypothetical protein
VSVPESPSVPEEVTLTLVTETEIDSAGATLIDLDPTIINTTSITFAVKFDTERTDSSTTIALFRGSTQLTTWTLDADDILDATYSATGLSAGTKYEFKLKVNGTTYVTQYVKTRAS